MNQLERDEITVGSALSAVLAFVFFMGACTAPTMQYFLGSMSFFFSLPLFIIIIKMLKRIWDEY